MNPRLTNGHLPLEQLFAASTGPRFVVDETCNTLFRNAAAKELTLPAEHPALTKLIQRCALRLRDRRSPNHLRQRVHVSYQEWLVTVEPLPHNLALLHPVFMIHLVSWSDLRSLSSERLAKLFALSEAELIIVHALTHQQQLREIARNTHQSLRNLCVRLRQLLNRYDVRSSAELLVLIHKLTRLSA